MNSVTSFMVDKTSIHGRTCYLSCQQAASAVSFSRPCSNGRKPPKGMLLWGSLTYSDWSRHGLEVLKILSLWCFVEEFCGVIWGFAGPASQLDFFIFPVLSHLDSTCTDAWQISCKPNFNVCFWRTQHVAFCYGICVLDLLRSTYGHAKHNWVYKGSTRVLVLKELHRRQNTHLPLK